MGTQFTWYMDDRRELETHVPGLKYKQRMFVLHDYAWLGNYGWLASFLLRTADRFNIGGRISSGYGYESWERLRPDEIVLFSFRTIIAKQLQTICVLHVCKGKGSTMLAGTIHILK
jgi:hypothetical protein